MLPVLCIGLWLRVYYTPDEPREAALIVAMADQAQQVIPELAGRYFLEKPPLLYWLGAVVAGAVGSDPWLLRLPGLAYALTAIGAIALVARRAAGPTAGFMTGMVAGTALICYQVEIWLATDAPLLAGVAVALAGIYLGLTAGSDRARLSGYATLHAGLLMAFFAKNFAGWLVPVLAFLTVLWAERRWRELLRPQLWQPLPLLAAPILAWAFAVGRLPDGAEALRVLFWNNLAGRAFDLGSAGAYVYTTGHHNAPGKYLLELPLYLLPWTPLAGAALARAGTRARAPGDVGTAWRLALGAIALPTLVLSLAATARGVYYGPPALGFALLIGLWAAEVPALLIGAPRRYVAASAVTAGLLGLLVGTLALAVALAPRSSRPSGLVLALVATAGVLATLAFAYRAAFAVATEQALGQLAACAACTLSLCVAPLYLCLNPWLDLSRTAASLGGAARAPLQFLDPDETTEALAELYLPAARVVADGAPRSDAWTVYQDPGRRTWTARDWLGFLGYRAPSPGTGAAPSTPVALAGWRLACLIERPGGRRYGLYAPPGTPNDTAACTVAGGSLP